MVVTIRLFAMLRERAGQGSLRLELGEGATVHDAIAAVGQRADLRQLVADLPLVMAVNRAYAAAETPLHEGDELALIPPLSGG